MSESFHFGERRAGPGGCCGFPEGCDIRSQGCIHKIRKKAWHDAVAAQASTSRSDQVREALHPARAEAVRTALKVISSLYRDFNATQARIAQEVVDAAEPILTAPLRAENERLATLVDRHARQHAGMGPNVSGYTMAEVDAVEHELDAARAENAELRAALARVTAWIAKADPLPECNGDMFADLRAAATVSPVPEGDEK